jgi:hypothetical protein
MRIVWKLLRRVPVFTSVIAQHEGLPHDAFNTHLARFARRC